MAAAKLCKSRAVPHVDRCRSLFRSRRIDFEAAKVKVRELFGELFADESPVKNTLVAILAFFGTVGCSRSGPPSGAAGSSGSGLTQSPRESLGNVMVQVARRFEIAGRAANANRFELAEFEASEIGELFDSDVPGAELPKEGPTAHIPAMAKAFAQINVPELVRGAASKDRSAFAAAFRSAALVCNACHQASAKGFIQVPSEPGKTVPDLDPAPPFPPTSR